MVAYPPERQLEKDRTRLVAYQMYREPKSQYGTIKGIVGRCEFGWEIIVAVAHLTYDLGVSLGKACSIPDFFQDLPLRKWQADALMKQLARHCKHQFAVLCMLIANSTIAYADETSWRLKSVWMFLSDQARLPEFGVNKDTPSAGNRSFPRTLFPTKTTTTGEEKWRRTKRC